MRAGVGNGTRNTMLNYEELRDSQRTPHDWVRSIKAEYGISEQTMQELASVLKSNLPEEAPETLKYYGMPKATVTTFIESLVAIILTTQGVYPVCPPQPPRSGSQCRCKNL